MELFINILLSLLIITAIVLCVFFIRYLKEIALSFKRIERDITELKENTLPILKNVEISSQQITRITDDLENKYADASDYVDHLKYKVKNFSLDGLSNQGNGNPVLSLIKNLNAVSKGITTFWSKMKE